MLREFKSLRRNAKKKDELIETLKEEKPLKVLNKSMSFCEYVMNKKHKYIQANKNIDDLTAEDLYNLGMTKRQKKMRDLFNLQKEIKDSSDDDLELSGDNFTDDDISSFIHKRLLDG